MPSLSAVDDGLRLLAGRELSVAELRARLLNREHPEPDVDAAVAHLIATGALDDDRVARAYVRTALNVKGRGRVRVLHELHAKGIAKDVAAAAVGEEFGGVDERALVSRAIQKKLRGRARPSTRADYARLYQHLMRQGFSPSVVAATLRQLRGEHADDDSM